MVCPKCGAENIEGSTFCVKCGINFNEYKEEVHEEVAENQPKEDELKEIKKEPVKESSGVVAAAAPLNYLMYLVNTVIKPKTTFDKEKEKLKDTKNAMILALIVSGAMTILNLLKTILNTVRYKSYSFTEGYKTVWDFSRIKNIKFIEVIGKNFLIYAGIIFAIAAVYYIACLIIKKDANFMRFLSISAASMVPFAVCYMILGPISNLIWDQLPFVFSMAGLVYSFTILYNLLDVEISVEGDIKIYFYAATTAILFIAGYYAITRLLISAVSSSLLGI